MRINKEKDNNAPSLFEIADRMRALDTFFEASAKKSSQLAEFIDDQSVFLYDEIAYRLTYSTPRENVGSFEPFLQQALTYLESLSVEEETPSNATGLRAILNKVFTPAKKANNARKSVTNVVEVSKKHGTTWVPLEFKKAVAYSMLALPILFVTYESMRVSIIAASLQKNLDSFTQAIVALYGITAVSALYAEQKTLRNGSKIVFNPYATLLGLGLTPLATSIISRTPKHVVELSAVASAVTLQNATDVAALTPMLAAITAASIWNFIDIGFNTASGKLSANNNSKVE